MANRTLDGLRVAALSASGFEEIELTEPMRALQEAGATVEIVSPETDEIQGMQRGEKSSRLPVDRPLTDVAAHDYDALLLPGGVKNPDRLRQEPRAVEFVRAIFDEGKPIAAICHAPWMLVEADVVRGRRLTSYPSLKTDIRNAGGEWLDNAVVVDQGLVTSRGPQDIPQFVDKMLEEFGEGTHPRRAVGAGALSS